MDLERFSLIDKVMAVDTVRPVLTAEMKIPGTSRLFDVHFPGVPVVPGTLLTEAMVQAAGLLVLACRGFAKLPALMAIDRARFRRYVQPGEHLTIKAQITSTGSGYVAAEGTVANPDGRVADAAVRLRLSPAPPAARAFMQERARLLGMTGAPNGELDT